MLRQKLIALMAIAFILALIASGCRHKQDDQQSPTVEQQDVHSNPVLVADNDRMLNGDETIIAAYSEKDELGSAILNKELPGGDAQMYIPPDTPFRVMVGYSFAPGAHNRHIDYFAVTGSAESRPLLKMASEGNLSRLYVNDKRYEPYYSLYLSGEEDQAWWDYAFGANPYEMGYVEIRKDDPILKQAFELWVRHPAKPTYYKLKYDPAFSFKLDVGESVQFYLGTDIDASNEGYIIGLAVQTGPETKKRLKPAHSYFFSCDQHSLHGLSLSSTPRMTLTTADGVACKLTKDEGEHPYPDLGDHLWQTQLDQSKRYDIEPKVINFYTQGNTLMYGVKVKLTNSAGVSTPEIVFGDHLGGEDHETPSIGGLLAGPYTIEVTLRNGTHLVYRTERTSPECQDGTLSIVVAVNHLSFNGSEIQIYPISTTRTGHSR